MISKPPRISEDALECVPQVCEAKVQMMCGLSATTPELARREDAAWSTISVSMSDIHASVELIRFSKERTQSSDLSANAIFYMCCFWGFLLARFFFSVNQPFVPLKLRGRREAASHHRKTNILHSQWKVYVRSMYKSIVYSFQTTIRRCVPKDHPSPSTSNSSSSTAQEQPGVPVPSCRASSHQPTPGHQSSAHNLACASRARVGSGE